MSTLTSNPHLDTNYGSSHISSKTHKMKACFHWDVTSIASKIKAANQITKQRPKTPKLPIFSTYSRSQLSKFAMKYQYVMSPFFIRIHALNNQSSKMCFANKTCFNKHVHKHTHFAYSIYNENYGVGLPLNNLISKCLQLVILPHHRKHPLHYFHLLVKWEDWPSLSQVYHIKLKFNYSTNIYWTPTVCQAACWEWRHRKCRLFSAFKECER